MNSSCSQANSDPQPVVACQALCYLCVGCTECPPGLVWPSGLRSPACYQKQPKQPMDMALFENGFSMAKSYGLPWFIYGLPWFIYDLPWFIYDWYGFLGFFGILHLVPKARILRVARFFRVMPAVLIRYFRTRNQVPWAAKTWRTTKPTNFDSVNDGKEIWE